ncbi:hypothetical protein N8725_00850 [Alphaproteobacteria bacterium]|nr:hypothetical protein [Alphaproteobacteria bacterium]MDC1085876.1 hypothetical protein [Alphaproteobacteria bacterium]
MGIKKVTKNRINKVVFLIQTSFSVRDYHRFGINILLKNGFEVYVVDFTPLINPKWHEIADTFVHKEFENLIYVRNDTQIHKELIKLNTNSFFICLFQLSLSTYKIYRFISKYKIPYGVIAWSAAVYEERFLEKKSSTIDKIIQKLKKFRLTRVKHYMLVYLPLSWLGLRSARYAFTASLSSGMKLKTIGKGTDVILIHSFDYDNYLDSLKMPDEHSNTAVFLDQNLPFHIDQLLYPAHNRPTSDTYFPDLCSAFDKIESFFDVKIIICSHPTANKSLLSELYGGREVVTGKTSNNVRSCVFCIAHHSTSISYAVMNKKPIIFITTNSIEQSSLAYKISKYASLFGKIKKNVSEEFTLDLVKDLEVDETAYHDYMNYFIKSDNSYDGKFWEIVSEKIKSI